jgi:predicted dehydrogenase
MILRNRALGGLMTDTRVGIGIIGTGFGATVAAPAFASVPGASVNAMCSGDARRAEATASALGVKFATDSIDALCARPDVDVVFVATPPHLHRSAVLAALDAGKHAICEKPFGLGPAEALEMFERAVQRDRLHFLDFEFRTLGARLALGSIVRRGRLGEIQHVVITAMVAGARFPVMNREGWWQRRDLGGGWLGAMGSHYIDAIRDWFGEVESVTASLETRRQYLASPEHGPPVTADDGFSFRLTTETGAVCTMNSSSTSGAEIGPRIEVYGSEGTAVLEHDRVVWVVDEHRDLTTQYVADPEDELPHPSLGPLGAWAQQIVHAVNNGEQVAPSFLDGLRCQEVLYAARRSSDDGGAITTVERQPTSIESTERGAQCASD